MATSPKGDTPSRVTPGIDSGADEAEVLPAEWWDDIPSPFKDDAIDPGYLEFLVNPEHGPGIREESAMILHENGVSDGDAFMEFAESTFKEVLNLLGMNNTQTMKQDILSIRAFASYAREQLYDEIDGVYDWDSFNREYFNRYGKEHFLELRDAFRNAIQEKMTPPTKPCEDDRSKAPLDSPSIETKNGPITGVKLFTRATGKPTESLEMTTLRNPDLYKSGSGILKRYSLSSKILWNGMIRDFEPSSRLALAIAYYANSWRNIRRLEKMLFLYSHISGVMC